MRKLLILPLLFSLLLGCGGKDTSFDNAIDKAERLVYIAPDSALLLLDSLQAQVNHVSESQRMRFLLVSAEAKNQADAPLLSDSLMSGVVDYYQHSGSSVERMRSLYQLGYIYAQTGEAPTALKYYHQALEEPVDTTTKDNCRQFHRIHSQIASLLCDQNMPLAQKLLDRYNAKSTFKYINGGNDIAF